MVGRLAAEVLRVAVRPGHDGRDRRRRLRARRPPMRSRRRRRRWPSRSSRCAAASGRPARSASRTGGSPRRSAAQVRGLMAPGLVDDAATRTALVAHAGVRAIAELWDRLDVALFGIGGPAWSASLVGDAIERQLEAAGAVGEVLVAPFDLDGRFVCPALARARDRLRRAASWAASRSRSGWPPGEAKVRPILGALRAGDRPDARHRRRHRRGGRRPRRGEPGRARGGRPR